MTDIVGGIFRSFVAACFCISGMYSSGWCAGQDACPPVLKREQGCVTGGEWFGGAPAVVIIQDLHCNPEAERNVFRIIETLNAIRPLDNLYLEGASGPLDTTWLSGLKNSRLRDAIYERLLESGKLTGAEYFCLKNGTRIRATGVDDARLHAENIGRLASLLERESSLRAGYAVIAGQIDLLKNRYYSRRNRRIDALSGPEADVRLFRMARRFGADLSRYPSLNARMRARQLLRAIDPDRVPREREACCLALRDRLPFGRYSALATDCPEGAELLWRELYPGSGNRDLAARFPHLRGYLEYLENTRAINPVALVREDRELRDELRQRVSGSDEERDIVFMSIFADRLGRFLEHGITSDEYPFIVAHARQFSERYERYCGSPDALRALDDAVRELHRYYEVNEERSGRMVRHMFPAGIRYSPGPSRPVSDGSLPALLRASPAVSVLLVGGYHTDGLARLLGAQGVSYVVVTPRVSGPSNGIYNELVRQQASTLQLKLFLSQGNVSRLQEAGAEFIAAVVQLEERGARLDDLNRDLEPAGVSVRRVSPTLYELIVADEHRRLTRYYEFREESGRWAPRTNHPLRLTRAMRMRRSLRRVREEAFRILDDLRSRGETLFGLLSGKPKKRILLVHLVDESLASLDYPMSVYTLRHYLKRHRRRACDVTVKDVQLEDLDTIVQYAAEHDFDLIGLSAMTGAEQRTREFLENYRQAMSRRKRKLPLLVVGKNTPTFAAKELLDEKKYPAYRDVLMVAGEGELALEGLVDYLRGARKLDEVPNLVYKNPEGGIERTGSRLLEGFDVLKGFRYDDARAYMKRGANMWMETARGCPWSNCTFCSTKVYWGITSARWRGKSVDEIIREMRYLTEDLGVHHITFTDEEFFGKGVENLARCERLVRAIIENGIRISFYINSRADSLFNKHDDKATSYRRENLLHMMRQAGLYMVYLGLETGSRTQLKRFAKGETLKEARGAVRMCKRAGVSMAIGWLMFEPLVTRAEVRESIQFIEEEGILEYLSTPLNRLRVYALIPLYKHIQNVEGRRRVQLLDDTMDVSSLTYPTVRYLDDDVHLLVQKIEAFEKQEKIVYDSIKWFVRFGGPRTQEYDYVRDGLEQLKANQVRFVKECVSLPDDVPLTEVFADLRFGDAVQRRDEILRDLRRKIVAMHHEGQCQAILKAMDDYFSKTELLAPVPALAVPDPADYQELLLAS